MTGPAKKPLIVTRCDHEHSPWRLQAMLPGAGAFWATSLEHLNQQLRDLERDGTLDRATTEPTGYHQCDAPGCRYAASRLVVRSEPGQWVLQMACEEHERYFFAADAPSEVLDTFSTEMADGVARLPSRALAKSDPASLRMIRLVTDRYPFRPEVVPAGP